MRKPRREISPSPASPPAAACHPLAPGERDKKVCVAKIGAAHGVRGEVRLWSFTQDPMAVSNYGPLETEDGGRRFEIETLRPGKDHLVARLAGVADRDAAQQLRNIKLYVPRERLPPVEDAETFYHADLIDLAAVTEDGAALGTVSAIHNFGAGDVIEISPPGGGEALMVQFTDAAVPKVDLAAKQIVVVPPTLTSIPTLKGEGRSRSGRGGVNTKRKR